MQVIVIHNLTSALDVLAFTGSPVMNGHSENGHTNTEQAEQPNAKEDDDDPPVEALPASEPRPGEELIVMQDTGFNIKIVAPGLEPFDLPVSHLNFPYE